MKIISKISRDSSVQKYGIFPFQLPMTKALLIKKNLPLLPLLSWLDDTHFRSYCLRRWHAQCLHRRPASLHEMPLLLPLILAHEFEMEKLFLAAGEMRASCCAVVIVRIASDSGNRLRSTIAFGKRESNGSKVSTVGVRWRWISALRNGILQTRALHTKSVLNSYCPVCCVRFTSISAHRTSRYPVNCGYGDESELFCCRLLCLRNSLPCFLTKQRKSDAFRHILFRQTYTRKQSELTFHQLSRQRKPQDYSVRCVWYTHNLKQTGIIRLNKCIESRQWMCVCVQFQA